MRWTIARKIGGLAAVLIVFILAILIHSIVVLQRIERELVAIATYDVPLAKMAVEAEIKQLEQHILLQRLFRLSDGIDSSDSHDPASNLNQLLAEETANFRLIAERIGASLALIDQGLASPALDSITKSQLRSARQALVAFDAQYHDFRTQFRQGVDTLNAQGTVDDPLLTALERQDHTLDVKGFELVESLEAFNLRQTAIAEQHEAAFFRINILLSTAAILIGTFLSYGVILGIKTNIQRLRKGALEITWALVNRKSPPAEALRLEANDEFADLSQSLTQLVDQFARDIDHREQFFAQLETLATTDKLTGVFNRYKWDQAVARELRTLQSQPFALCLILFDIDHFKSINDQFGHDVGDRVIVGVAGLAKAQLAEHDAIYRLGGDEFAVLVYHRDPEATLAVADAMRCAVATADFQLPAATTLSLGLTQGKPEDSVDEFFKRADRALYWAKEDGRNCARALW
ncbi:MAG: GGDEF domain-containing protein [Candidatus Competibacterales bacterium]